MISECRVARQDFEEFRWLCYVKCGCMAKSAFHKNVLMRKHFSQAHSQGGLIIGAVVVDSPAAVLQPARVDAMSVRC